MSELREAAKEALRWMEHARLHLTIKERMHPDGLSLYDSAAEALRAALAQPESRPCTCHPDDNPPQPCAQRYALTECKALAQPEAEAGVSWGGHNVRGDADSIAEVRRLIEFEDARQGTKPATGDDLRVYDAIAANYVHPPSDEWRPASEPPEDGRRVLIWVAKSGGETFRPAYCPAGGWTSVFDGETLAAWRDINPPTEGAK